MFRTIRVYWVTGAVFFLSTATCALGAWTENTGSRSFHVQARGVVQSISMPTNRVVIDGKTFAFSPRMKVYKYVPATDGSASGLKQHAAVSDVMAGDVIDFRQEGTMITEIYLKRW